MTGEDERSTEKNISALQAEMKKSQPDKTVVGDKMKRTVAHRQKMCSEKPASEVVETFPSLKHSFFVSFTEMETLIFYFSVLSFGKQIV